MNLLDLEPLIDMAIMEDIGKGDITTDLCIRQKSVVEAQIVANEEEIIAGLDVAELVFKKVNEKVKFEKKIEDGKRIKKGEVVVFIKGNAQDIGIVPNLLVNLLLPQNQQTKE